MAEFELTSSAFENEQPIPRKYTCEGEDVSPPLAWSGFPEGTVSLALVVDDPDAPRGTFTHWLAWGLDPTSSGLSRTECSPSPSWSGHTSASNGWGGRTAPADDGFL